MDRDMTDDERRWWESLKRVLRKMPRTIELNARYGGVIGIAPAGARKEWVERDGDFDAISFTEWDSINVPRLDGRDSQI